MEILENQGFTLNEYCELNEISPASVWQKIRQGELVSRTVSGRLKIFGKEDLSEFSPRVIGATVRDEASLPDLPNVLPFRTDLDEETKTTNVTESNNQISIYEPEQTSEIALLIDHLSLAKEENREILRMTRESIGKITEMSEQLLESKEQIIDAHKQTIQEKNLIIEVQQEKIENLRLKLKDASLAVEENNSNAELANQRKMYEDMLATKEQRITDLSDKVKNMESEIRALRQDYEDLEMLARTLAHTPT